MAGIGVVIRVDEADSTTTYTGYTTAGLRDDTGSAVWAIKQTLIENSTQTVTGWASDDFDQIWANRASLTYT